MTQDPDFKARRLLLEDEVRKSVLNLLQFGGRESYVMRLDPKVPAELLIITIAEAAP